MSMKDQLWRGLAFLTEISARKNHMSCRRYFGLKYLGTWRHCLHEVVVAGAEEVDLVVIGVYDGPIVLHSGQS